MADLQDTAVQLAREAGQHLRRIFESGRQAEQIGHKGAIDLVTRADRESEEHIRRGIEHQHPNHSILAEEGGASGPANAAFRWVVDPLDGTVNFAHGVPHFAVLIAVQQLCSQGYRDVLSVTYEPLRQELFVAERDGGAYLNGHRIGVSHTRELIDAIGATGFAYDRLFRERDNHAEFCRMNLLTQGLRRFGSAGLDLAWVACGRFDFFWEYGLKPWDVIAGRLLVREAGGKVSALPANGSGGEHVLASNGALHSVTAQALESAQQVAVNARQGLATWLPERLGTELESND